MSATLFGVPEHNPKPCCCHEDAIAVMEDELVVAFSGSGVKDFVLSSGIGVVVIIVF